MSKEIYISSTPHETRLAIVEHDELTEIYYERENEYTLAGSIYNGKVTRVLPGMQSSFVDVGLERDAFLYITDFMEEAGDSADFDSSETRGRSNGRRNDRSRDGQSTDLAPAESQERSLPELASSPDREPRSEIQLTEQNDRGGRNDRGDRGRRRNRGGNRDVQPRDTRPAPELATSEDRSPEPPAPMQLSTPERGNEAELGEGAPGADGSRRWRGRRGRRRGRSGNREGMPTGQALSGPTQEDPSTFAPDPSSGYDLSEAYDELELDGSATQPAEDHGHLMDAEATTSPHEELKALQSGVESSPVSTSSQRESRPAGPREPNDHGRRERGGRGRDRRDDRPRAPRGFAPSRSLYGVDDSADQHETDAPPSEPIILPGESLSKYRQGGEAGQSTASTPLPANPAPDFILPGTWDGGNVLPGETIRPRSPSSSSSSSAEPRREGRHESGRGPASDRGRREDRFGNRGNERGGPPREPQASFTVAPIVPLRNQPASTTLDVEGPAVATPPEAELSLTETTPLITHTESHEAPIAETHVSPPSLTESPLQHDLGQDYEPTEAAASHRFDPLPPREFRQPAPDVEAVDVALTSAHSITPAAGTPLAPLYEEGPSRAEAEHASASLLIHDLTSISPDGEMVSQAPAPPPAQEVDEPTSPVQHETAILHAESDTEITVSEIEASAPLLASEPEISEEADNLIVEELAQESDAAAVEEVDLDEEDFRTTTLHAASIEEMDYDDDEEETLEGAADLGTMLREMSIDQITQPVEPALEEDEDDFAFEEEDSVEDGIFTSSLQEASVPDPMGFTEADFGGEPAVTEDGLDAPSALVGGESNPQEELRNDRRRGGRRDNRRGGRDRDRGGDRPRSVSSAMASGSGDTGADRDRSAGSRPGRRDGHRSAQTTNLPAISDLLKPGQEVLVQIAKEPIAKKGARITSHIALPGRFLVFMPTVNHTGVSRKIESDGERRRLKEILLSEKGEASGGFIVRTAAAGATEEELRSDLRFLLNLWADIKQRSESSKSPALIYHDLNLVERVLRDQVTDNFSAIWVDTESEYERVLRFLQRFQPSLIRRVKLYTKDTPLFEQFGITEEINKALRSKVWLKSGGSIVINQTEALVAIDINTGKYVGKTARLEDTIVKTNLDAIPEIVRQIRLRDLGGIIIIDFIDMDERKNRHKVMAVLEEELKKDRAPSKVLQFNDFGLVAITRKRVKQSLERTLSATCGICAGTGMVKSAVTVCNDIYIEMRKMQKHLDRGDVMLRVNPEVVKQLKSPTAKWLQEMEEMVGKTILVKSDPTLHPEQFDIH